MSSEFPKVPLGDLTINYDAKRRPVKASDRKAGPYPYYGASGIVDYVDGYLFDGEYLLVGEDGENMRTRQTPIAFLAKGKFWVNNHAHIVRGNCSASTKYLKYALAVTDISAYLTGAVMPKLTQGNLNKIPIPCPALEVQKRIVRLLGSLDDSIDSLQHQNATLESIAQRLFRSWFVNFDPVHAKAAGQEPEAMSAELAALFPSEFAESALGLIPKGWSATTFGDAFHINPRRSLSKAFMAPHLEMASVSTAGHRPSQRLPLRAFSSGTKYINGDTLLARITPCLENGKTAFVDFLKPNEVGWGSTEFIVIRSKDGYPQFWSYLLARQKQFRTFAIKAMTGTSGRQRVDVATLQTYRLAMPPIELATATAPVFDSINKQMTINAEISLVLAELRDHLLPRLISGKLSLADAEAALAAVKPEVEQASDFKVAQDATSLSR